MYPPDAVLNGSSAAPRSTTTYNDQMGREAYHAQAWTQAITFLKRALDGKDDASDDDDQTARTRRYYAQALHMAGKHDLAVIQFQSIVLWAEEKFGPEHDKTMKRRMLLAYSLKAGGLLDSAKKQFRLAAEGFERAFNGEDTPDSLQCRYEFGVLLSQHEAYDRSWPHWQEAEKNLRRAAQGFAKLSPLANESLDAQIAYAEVLRRMCKDEEARSQFEKSIEIATHKRLPKDDGNMKKIEEGIRECEHWLSKPMAFRLGDRLPAARERERKQQEQKVLQELTMHWRQI
jgi:tetratricopeptide (TPR) repeat protein